MAQFFIKIRPYAAKSVIALLCIAGLALALILLSPQSTLAASVPASPAVDQLSNSGVEATAHQWQLGMQPAFSPIKEKIHNLHHWLLYIIFGIVLFVLALLVVVVRFRASKNPVASKRTHNLPLEVVWIAIPALILIVLAVPSFRLLYYGGQNPEASMTVKIVGHQWYWQYVYADDAKVAAAAAPASKEPGKDGDKKAGENAVATAANAEPVAPALDFDSRMIPTEELKPGQKRLLEVDNPMVLPVGEVVRLQFTGADVIHGWMVPALGIHRNTVPGKLTEAWVRIDKPGTFYGQCMQICGVNHGFMPIVVHALPKVDYDKWLVLAKQNTAAGQPLPDVSAISSIAAPANPPISSLKN
ncbi:MAG: cytochrome c oxidase subunit II [Holosporaceae bacterium]